MTVDDKCQESSWSSILERITRLEVSLENMARHTDVVRLEERVVALSEVITKFIKLKDFHNDILEKRVVEAEKTLMSTAVKISPINNLGQRVVDLEKSASGINVKLAIIGVVGTASLAGVISLLFSLISK